MKRLLLEHPLLYFILMGLLLPAISIFIVVVDELMPQSLNENPLLFGVSFIHTFGITNLILYSIIANNRLFQTVRLRSIAFVCVATTLVSYLIPYLTTPVLRGAKWGIDYLVHALLFSVLPAVLPIIIKYAVWRIKRKQNAKQDDIA